jgi:hypothetical protein
MFLKLRVTFTILSALCLAAIIPVGTFFDFVPAILCALAGGVFFLLMLFFKNKQEQKENPPTPENNADYFNPQKSNDSSKTDKE